MATNFCSSHTPKIFETVSQVVSKCQEIYMCKVETIYTTLSSIDNNISLHGGQYVCGVEAWFPQIVIILW